MRDEQQNMSSTEDNARSEDPARPAAFYETEYVPLRVRLAAFNPFQNDTGADHIEAQFRREKEQQGEVKNRVLDEIVTASRRFGPIQLRLPRL